MKQVSGLSTYLTLVGGWAVWLWYDLSILQLTGGSMFTSATVSYLSLAQLARSARPERWVTYTLWLLTQAIYGPTTYMALGVFACYNLVDQALASTGGRIPVLFWIRLAGGCLFPLALLAYDKSIVGWSWWISGVGIFWALLWYTDSGAWLLKQLRER